MVLGSLEATAMCLLVDKKLQLNFANMFGSGACLVELVLLERLVNASSKSP